LRFFPGGGKAMVKFVVNGREAYSEKPGDTPLKEVLL